MTLSVKIVDMTGKTTGESALPPAIFGLGKNDSLLFDAVVTYLANHRQGTAKVKTRSEVRGGGKKPFKQKGTGRARQGTSRSPLMPGGGKIFGPEPRDYEIRMPGKMRRKAVLAALSQKCRENKIVVLQPTELKKPKTKTISALLEKMNIGNVLVVDRSNKNLEKSARNVRNVKYLDVGSLNVFDLLKYENLILSAEALKIISEGRAS